MQFGMRTMNKYRAKRVGNFASKLEAAVYDLLKMREECGEITGLKCQVEIKLTKANIIYKPDFAFIENHQAAYAEAKGFETQAWRLKKRLWEHYGPGPLYIYSGSYHRPSLVETIIPKGEA